jgi:hypothetical protein
VHTVTATNSYTYTQVVFIDKTLTLRGGFDAGNWAAPPEPFYQKSVIDAERSGRAQVSVIRTAYTISRSAAGPVLIAAAVCSPITSSWTCSIRTLLTTLAAPRTVIGTQTGAVYIFTTPGTDHRLRILR